MAIVTELVTKFSFAGSDAPLKSFNATLGKGIGLLAGMGAAAFATGAAIAKWTQTTLAGEQSLINLASETGVAIERLQELQYIASVNNSDANALNSSISNLSKTIGDAAQKGNEDFSRLGISVRDANGQIKGADQILTEVGESFKRLGLSTAEQRSFAEALGIDPSLLLMMGRTSAEMETMAARARELGILNKEQTAFAQDFNDSMTTMQFAMDGVRRLVAVGLGPELKAMVESFTELLTENRDWIVNGVQFAVGVLHDFLKMLGRIWPVLLGGVAVFAALKVATIGWGASLAAVFSPALLIAAGIAAILLAIDDLIVAFNGGQSVIRDFFLEFFGWDIKPVLENIVQAFKDLFSGIGKLLEGDFAGGLDDLTKAFTAWVDLLVAPFKAAFSAVFDWMKNAITGLLPQWAVDLIASDTPQQTIDSSMRPGGSVSNMSSNSSVSQQVQMNISTPDPVRAGEVAADSLQRQLSDAQTQARRGGF